MLEISKLFFFKEQNFVIKNEILLEWGGEKKKTLVLISHIYLCEISHLRNKEQFFFLSQNSFFIAKSLPHFEAFFPSNCHI